MENISEKRIPKLAIKFEWTLAYKTLTAVWLIIEFCAFLDNSRFYSDYYHYYYIWEIPFYDLELYGGNISMVNLLCGIVITIFIGMIPFIIKFAYNYYIEKNELILSEDQLIGIVKKPFSKKQIRISINDIENIFIKKQFADKLRSGKTLEIYYNSCVIKFHYAQNAEEFADEIFMAKNMSDTAQGLLINKTQ